MELHKVPGDRQAIAAPFFSHVEETLVWSVLDGSMGEAVVDDLNTPTCARLDVGGFAFLGGDATAPGAALLVDGLRKPDASELAMPCAPGWEALLAALPGARAITRYATHKDTVFDTGRLQQYADDLPEPFTYRNIDTDLYEKCLRNSFSEDFVANFATAEEFTARGFGICVMYKDEIVGGASSYTVYKGGIEIEIDIRRDMRRRGLATAVGAKLILACLERGLYPSWDAATPISLALAEKLGYRAAEPYTVYLPRPDIEI